MNLPLSKACQDSLSTPTERFHLIKREHSEPTHELVERIFVITGMILLGICQYFVLTIQYVYRVLSDKYRPRPESRSFFRVLFGMHPYVAAVPVAVTISQLLRPETRIFEHVLRFWFTAARWLGVFVEKCSGGYLFFGNSFAFVDDPCELSRIIASAASLITIRFLFSLIGGASIWTFISFSVGRHHVFKEETSTNSV